MSLAHWLSSLSLERAAGIAFLLHLFTAIAVIGLSDYSGHINRKVYTVSLITQQPEPATQPITAPAPTPAPAPAPPKAAAVAKPAPQNKAAAPSSDAAEAKRYREQKLKAMREDQELERHKQDSLDKIEDYEARFNAAQKAAMERARQAAKTPEEREYVIDKYSAGIVEEIRKNWVFTDTARQDLAATVLVRISRDGAIEIISVETPSGDRIYDQSILRAIRKTGRVTPPPFNDSLTLGLIFRPEGL